MITLYRFAGVVTLLALSLSALAQSNTRNFVLTRTYNQIGATEANGTTYAGSPYQVSTAITYLDGLGQPIQQVAPFANPAYQDLISQTQYDNQFRVAKAYLPVAVPAGNNGQFVASPSSAYYNSSAVCTPTPNAFSQTAYELSPLNRSAETKAPGVTGNGVRQAYLVNAANSVKYYATNGATLYNLNLGLGYYAANTLTYTETKDENDKTVQEFRDSYNRVVLKRVVASPQPLDTYYVYGESGLLRAVLQPMFQDNSDASLYAFLYEYDSRGRLYKKKVPGAAEATLTYDGRDRLINMIDARGQTFYYKYDELNRQIEMGITVSGTNNALRYNYYDNYSASGWTSFVNELNLTLTDQFVNAPMTDSRQGLLTGSSVRMLNADGTLGNWQRSVLYYDNKGRLIQTVRELFGLGANATERVSLQLDFVGRPVLSHTSQQSSTLGYRIEKAMSYDPAGRLSYVGHKVYEYLSSVWTLKKSYNHSRLAYNEVGQLSQKKLQTAVVSQSYGYTPRGWLCSQSSGNDNTGTSYLSQSLSYDPNGNLSGQSSATGGSAGGATYSYDAANRLTGYSSTGSWAGYAESGMSYDKNGNLLTLNRSYGGSMSNTLSYSYAGTGNRLNQVEDGAGNTDPAKGFVNGGSSAANELAYDAAGNLTQDLNRGILAGGIVYNVLNLPRQVTKGGQQVKYDYDAAGVKRQVTAPGGDQTLYEEEFEYNSNGVLARINLEEGQLLRDVSGVYTVQYSLKDHLGNVRVVVKEDGSMVQQTDYYAFGLPMLKTGTVAVNKYLTSGKEVQPQTNWLDFGARMYDPTIGKWLTIDPLAETSRRWSPYTYVYNNPLRFIDPDGMEGQEFKRSERDDMGNMTF